jgi:hypothetical protein
VSARSIRSVLTQYAGRVVQSLPSLPRSSSHPSPTSSQDLGQFNNSLAVPHITESLLEGVVGSFGRWIGADRSASSGSGAIRSAPNGFGDLREALNLNQELRKGSKVLESLSSLDQPPSQTVEKDGEWEEW